MTSLRGILHEKSTSKLGLADSCKVVAPTNLQVLFFGAEQMEEDIYNALLRLLCSRIFVTRECHELWLLPSGEVFHLAILDQTLSDLDLEVASRIIRQKWVDAKILLLREDAELLDDALYDDRLAPTATTETLLETVRRLLNLRCESR